MKDHMPTVPLPACLSVCLPVCVSAQSKATAIIALSARIGLARCPEPITKFVRPVFSIFDGPPCSSAAATATGLAC